MIVTLQAIRENFPYWLKSAPPPRKTARGPARTPRLGRFAPCAHPTAPHTSDICADRTSQGARLCHSPRMSYRIQTSQQRSGDKLWGYRILDSTGQLEKEVGYSYYSEESAKADAREHIRLLEDLRNPRWKDAD